MKVADNIAVDERLGINLFTIEMPNKKKSALVFFISNSKQPIYHECCNVFSTPLSLSLFSLLLSESLTVKHEKIGSRGDVRGEGE
jgi:hypothetical protein